MRRLIVTFDDNQHAWLIEKSATLQVSMAYLVRKGLDSYITLSTLREQESKFELSPEEVYKDTPHMSKYFKSKATKVTPIREEPDMSGPDVPF